jgi:hypothetical protein
LVASFEQRGKRSQEPGVSAPTVKLVKLIVSEVFLLGKMNATLPAMHDFQESRLQRFY